MSKLASADMERLSKLLGNELEIYGEIQKLTEKQADLLAKDDIEGFDSSLDKRAELIEKIKGLHQESDPLMQSYVSVSTNEDTTDSKIEELRKQINEILEVCAGLNDKNIASMKVKTEEHTKKIDEQRAKGKGIGGYAQSVPNTPEVFDKKS